MSLIATFDRLIEASIHSAGMVGIVFLLTVLLGRWIPALWRCALWMLVFARLILPALPPSPASLLNLSSKPNVADEIVRFGIVPDSAIASPAQSSTTIAPNRSLDLKNVAAQTWLVGASLLIALAIIRFIRLNIRLSKLTPSTNPAFTAHGMRAVETDMVSSPAVAGIFRATLILPIGLADRLGPEEIRFIFEHELAHHRRRDVLAGVACSLIAALHWFNPFVWIARSRFAAERELACDASVLRNLAPIDRPSYGKTILKLLDAYPPHRMLPTAAAMLSRRGTIRRRIAAIASFPAQPRRISIVGPMLFIALGCSTLTSRQPQQTADPQSVMRVYDVRDLIVDISSFPPDEPGKRALRPTTRPRDQIVRELITSITSSIDPLSWRENTGAATIRELEGQLVVEQTPHNHDLILEKLQKMRAKSAVQVLLETRFISDATTLEQLSDAAKWIALPKSDADLYPRFFSEAEANELTRLAQRNINTTIVTAPRIILFDGQRGYVLVGRQTAYVADLHPSGNEFKPQIEIADSGVLLDCQVKVSDDKKFVTLNLRPKLSTLVDLRPAPWPGDKSQSIQVAEMVVREADATITMPDQRTAIYRIHPKHIAASQPANDPPVFMLVKPRIIIQRETEAGLTPPKPLIESGRPGT